MAAPRFSVGQTMHLLKDLRSSKGQSDGFYTIIRVMPNEGEETSYRVRHEAEAFERVVTESQLTEPERITDESVQGATKSKARGQ